eukprot:TRINITY_DN1645_c0_g1_i3.p1 TRINITY_DN1645_c0_g1~~TRINITY_DN1645_c0_g1_i3.p1  ORF type:complete len:668 (-),score=145.59 TRINITY_DN1645_c0_g1_i3:64-1947(-)
MKYFALLLLASGVIASEEGACFAGTPGCAIPMGRVLLQVKQGMAVDTRNQEESLQPESLYPDPTEEMSIMFGNFSCPSGYGQHFNGQEFFYMGKTLDGRPYYADACERSFFYYDVSCAQDHDAKGWILGGKPETDRSRDLNPNDGIGCHNDFRIAEDWTVVQEGSFPTVWMWCGNVEESMAIRGSPISIGKIPASEKACPLGCGPICEEGELLADLELFEGVTCSMVDHWFANHASESNCSFQGHLQEQCCGKPGTNGTNGTSATDEVNYPNKSRVTCAECENGCIVDNACYMHDPEGNEATEPVCSQYSGLWCGDMEGGEESPGEDEEEDEEEGGGKGPKDGKGGKRQGGKGGKGGFAGDKGKGKGPRGPGFTPGPVAAGAESNSKGFGKGGDKGFDRKGGGGKGKFGDKGKGPGDQSRPGFNRMDMGERGGGKKGKDGGKGDGKTGAARGGGFGGGGDRPSGGAGAAGGCGAAGSAGSQQNTLQTQPASQAQQVPQAQVQPLPGMAPGVPGGFGSSFGLPMPGLMEFPGAGLGAMSMPQLQGLQGLQGLGLQGLGGLQGLQSLSLGQPPWAAFMPQGNPQLGAVRPPAGPSYMGDLGDQLRAPAPGAGLGAYGLSQAMPGYKGAS